MWFLTGNLTNKNFKSMKINIKNLIKYDINIILKELEINLQEYINLCIMCGCDYTCGIRGVSSLKGYSLIKKGVTDEYMCSNIENYKEIFEIFNVLS